MIQYPFNTAYPITQRYGEHPGNYPKTKGHMGLDFGTPIGTATSAPITGRIAYAGYDKPDAYNGGYGLYVKIVALDSKMTVFLAHLSEVDVQTGDNVVAGWEIGHTGNTGNSTGPHLHLEVRPDGINPVDPEPLLGTAGPIVTPTTWPKTPFQVRNITQGLNIRTAMKSDPLTQILGTAVVGGVWTIDGLTEDDDGVWVRSGPTVHLAGWLVQVI